MNDRNTPEVQEQTITPPVRKWKRLVWIIPLALIIIVLLIALLLPVWISSSSGRTFIVNKVNESTSGKLAIGELSVGWFSGIDASDLSFSDAKEDLRVSVKKISAAPRYLSLLGGNVELGKTVIEKPEIEVRINEPRSASTAESKESKAAASGPVGLPVKMLDLTITEGKVKIVPSVPGMQAVQMSNIAAKVEIRPGGEKSDFNLALNVESGGGSSDIKASGSATGITRPGWRLTDTTGELKIQVNDLDLGSLQGFLAAGGIKLQAAGRLTSDVVASVDNGKVKQLDININGQNLAIGGEAFKGDIIKTSKLKVAAKVSTEAEILRIEDALIAADWLDLKATGTLPTKAFSASDLLSPGSAYTLKAGISCNAAQVLSQIPNTLGIKPGMQITSGSLNAELDSSVSGGQRVLSANATIANLKGTMEGKAIALSAPVTLEARVASNGTSTSLDKGTFASSFGNIDCKGSFDNISYTARLDLAKLVSELGQFIDTAGYSLGGTFEGNGNVMLKGGTTTAAGKSAISSMLLSVKGKQAGLQRLSLDHNIRYDGNGKELAIEALKADGDFGTVTVSKANVAMGDKTAVKMPVTAQLDLKKLLPFAALFAELPKEMDLGGKLEANISAAQEGTAWRITVKDTSISDFLMVYPGQSPLKQKQIKLAFDGIIDPAGETISLKDINLASDLINVSGIFEKSSTKTASSLKGQLKAQYDLAAVSTLAAPYLPQGMTMKGARKHDVSFSSTWPSTEPEKMLANMNAVTTLGFDELKYMGMTFGKTDLDVTIEKGLLSIKPFSAPLNNGRLNFGATADFTKTPTILVLSNPMAILDGIRITDEMVGYDKVKKWLNMIPLMSDASSVTGIAGFKCRELKVPLKGAGAEAIVAAGTFDVNDLRTNSGLLRQLSSAIGRDASAITVLPTDFTLSNGVVKYDSLKMLVAGEMVEFQGWIGLNNTMDLSVVTPVKVSGGRLSLRIDGSPTKPNLNLGKTIQENLPGLILQEALKRR